MQLWSKTGKEMAGNGGKSPQHTHSGTGLMALRCCSDMSSQERSLNPIPGLAPEMGIPSSQLLALEGLRLHLETAVHMSFGAAVSARPEWLVPKEGTRTRKDTPSPRLPAVSLPASPPACLPLADFFQACFLSTADSLVMTNREQAAMQITWSPPQCTAAHRVGDRRAQTPHQSKPAVP